jgi:hypothetical protein
VVRSGSARRAGEWLRIWADLGRAPRTIDAYGRGLAEYLLVCERDGVDPLTANRSQVALLCASWRPDHTVALPWSTSLQTHWSRPVGVPDPAPLAGRA